MARTNSTQRPTERAAVPVGASGGRTPPSRAAIAVLVGCVLAAVWAAAMLTPFGRVGYIYFFAYSEFYMGVLSLVSLSITIMVGLVATDRLVLSIRQRVLLQTAHRTTGVIAVGALLLHIWTKVMEGHARLIDVFVPFLWPYNRWYVGFGTISALIMIAVMWTGFARTRFIGWGRPWMWRSVHAVSYLMWPIALVHGLSAGRPAATWVIVSYVVCVLGVLIGLAVRLAVSFNRRKDFSSASSTGSMKPVGKPAAPAGGSATRLLGRGRDRGPAPAEPGHTPWKPAAPAPAAPAAGTTVLDTGPAAGVRPAGRAAGLDGDDARPIRGRRTAGGDETRMMRAPLARDESRDDTDDHGERFPTGTRGRRDDRAPESRYDERGYDARGHDDGRGHDDARGHDDGRGHDDERGHDDGRGYDGERGYGYGGGRAERSRTAARDDRDDAYRPARAADDDRYDELTRAVSRRALLGDGPDDAPAPDRYAAAGRYADDAPRRARRAADEDPFEPVTRGRRAAADDDARPGRRRAEPAWDGGYDDERPAGRRRGDATGDIRPRRAARYADDDAPAARYDDAPAARYDDAPAARYDDAGRAPRHTDDARTPRYADGGARAARYADDTPPARYADDDAPRSARSPRYADDEDRAPRRRRDDDEPAGGRHSRSARAWYEDTEDPDYLPADDTPTLVDMAARRARREAQQDTGRGPGRAARRNRRSAADDADERYWLQLRGEAQ